MSSQQSAEIACPECGHVAEYALWSGVNVTLEPDLKDEVLRHELNRVSCAGCGELITVVTIVVYHDMEAGIMIELRPDQPEFDARFEAASDSERRETEDWAKRAVSEMGYKLRRVTSMSELIEKVRIFDLHLDDRVVEVIKTTLARGAPESVLQFVDLREKGEEGPLLVFERHGEDRHERLTLPRDIYDEMAGKMDALPQPGPDRSGNWPRVDVQFSRQFLD